MSTTKRYRQTSEPPDAQIDWKEQAEHWRHVAERLLDRHTPDEEELAKMAARARAMVLLTLRCGLEALDAPGMPNPSVHEAYRELMAEMASTDWEAVLLGEDPLVSE